MRWWPRCGFRYFTPPHVEPEFRIWRKCSKPWGHWLLPDGMPHEGDPL